MASNFEIWTPLSELKSRDRYLYHYTTIENCFKILYYKTLQFSSFSITNDILEQKPKVCYSSMDVNMQEKYRKVKNMLLGRRKKMQLLCFSQDIQKGANTATEADVTGRGFALPRMWAQYASKNQGVCLIINKKSMINQLKKLKISFYEKKVKYCDALKVYPLDDKDVNDLEKNIENPFVLKNNDYIDANYFTKLKDWENEQEYRIAAFGNKTIKIENLFGFLEGIVIGANCDEVYGYLLSKLCSNHKIQVRKIFYDYTITSIVNLHFSERNDFNAFEI